MQADLNTLWHLPTDISIYSCFGPCSLSIISMDGTAIVCFWLSLQPMVKHEGRQSWVMDATLVSSQFRQIFRSPVVPGWKDRINWHNTILGHLWRSALFNTVADMTFVHAFNCFRSVSVWNWKHHATSANKENANVFTDFCRFNERTCLFVCCFVKDVCAENVCTVLSS